MVVNQNKGESMIKQEILENGLVKTYSDSGKYIIQNETGVEYTEAVDIPNKYTYTESNKDIEKLEEKPNIE